MGPQAYYFSELAKGRLLIQRCKSCASLNFYPRVFCLECEDDKMDWIPAGGYGTVYSMTTIKGWSKDEADKNISIVELDEGVRLLSAVEGVPPQDVIIGMRVRAKFVLRETTSLLTFEPASMT